MSDTTAEFVRPQISEKPLGDRVGSVKNFINWFLRRTKLKSEELTPAVPIPEGTGLYNLVEAWQAEKSSMAAELTALYPDFLKMIDNNPILMEEPTLKGRVREQLNAGNLNVILGLCNRMGWDAFVRLNQKIKDPDYANLKRQKTLSTNLGTAIDNKIKSAEGKPRATAMPGSKEGWEKLVG